MVWGRPEKHFWTILMECGRPPRKANLTSVKSHTSVSKCALLLWNPPLSPTTSLFFYAYTLFPQHRPLMWRQKVRVSVKIHIQPSPVTLMNSPISRFLFLLVYPPNNRLLKPQPTRTVVLEFWAATITLYKCSGLLEKPHFPDVLKGHLEWTVQS